MGVEAVSRVGVMVRAMQVQVVVLVRAARGAFSGFVEAAVAWCMPDLRPRRIAPSKMAAAVAHGIHGVVATWRRVVGDGGDGCSGDDRQQRLQLPRRRRLRWHHATAALGAGAAAATGAIERRRRNGHIMGRASPARIVRSKGASVSGTRAGWERRLPWTCGAHVPRGVHKGGGIGHVEWVGAAVAAAPAAEPSISVDKKILDPRARATARLMSVEQPQAALQVGHARATCGHERTQESSPGPHSGRPPSCPRHWCRPPVSSGCSGPTRTL